ncbi:pyridoxal phosphate-dependent transferase [Spinellus fusiger]|nr:pyridoxal phosphate-dependent transferase [Spinellus fusiger]
MSDIHHYPAADQEPAKSKLAGFLWPMDALKHNGRLLLGNGASELIDLVVRKALEEARCRGVHPTWKAGPWHGQYQEYERSARTHGFKILDPFSKERADMVCIVNPCNPTGDYLPIEELKAWLRENAATNGTVMVDESMQLWHSSEFRSDSLISQHEFMQSMLENINVSVHVMHSWTKIWSCTGLRVGSVICPTVHHCEALRKIQVPWSVNGPALKFVEAVVKDTDYLNETWNNTTHLRTYLIEQLKTLNAYNGQWVFYGKPFLSWVWLDVGSEAMAAKAVDKARAAGVPVRSGKPGYNCNTFVRIAVRQKDKVAILIKAWQSL